MIERSCAKDDHPHFKNEREKLWSRQQSSHYIGEVVKVGYWLSVVKWCLKSTQSGSLCCHNIKCAEFGPFGVHQNHPGPFQRVLTNIEIWAEWKWLIGWSMKNRSKCNFFRYSGQSNPRPTYGQRSFWPNMTVLRSKMSEPFRGCDGGPVIIWRKGKGVVHEKSVKMQLLQIQMAIKPPTLIWTEIILAKYDRPQVKNEREHPVVHLRSRHYMEKR